jgi:hypothetical protein
MIRGCGFLNTVILNKIIRDWGADNGGFFEAAKVQTSVRKKDDQETLWGWRGGIIRLQGMEDERMFRGRMGW